MSRALKDLLAALFMVGLCVLSEVLAMMCGWGLKPRSWWWIIGIGFFVNLGLRVLASKVTEKSK